MTLLRGPTSSRQSGSHEPCLVRNDDRSGTVTCAQLCEDASDMSFDRALAENQRGGDLLVGSPSSEQHEDLQFALGQPAEVAARLRGGAVTDPTIRA